MGETAEPGREPSDDAVIADLLLEAAHLRVRAARLLEQGNDIQAALAHQRATRLEEQARARGGGAGC